jgi:rhamnosyltransferase
MENPKVTILLSTYNGEKYLETQLNSLIKQQNVEIDILVRDDGSTDNTKQILKAWENKSLLDWYEGENLKPTRSYLDLMKKAENRDSDYYAFCDQDDFWFEKKLDMAIQNISLKTPSLYYSDTILVDEELNKIMKSEFIKSKLSFHEVLMKNNASGCTMVFNKKLLKIINSFDSANLSGIPLHDHWTHIICLAVNGETFYDENSYIYYRQHNDNVIGGSRSLFNKIINNSLFNNKNTRNKWATNLLFGYGNFIDNEKLILLKLIKNYKDSFWHKIKLIKKLNIKKISLINRFIIYINIIFGKL